MNLISIADAEKNLENIFEMSAKLKKKNFKVLNEKTLAMIFEKPSTRTRVSFEAAMTQLGGHAIYLDRTNTQLKRGETIKDTARTLSRYVDGIMLRANEHEDVVELGGYSTVPVINGLTDLEHPCQVLSDLFTIKEFKNSFNVKLAYVGDGNNVCNSLLLGSSIVGMDISVACPKGYEPDEEILRKAKKYAKKSGADIEITADPAAAVTGAEIIYTDVWVSMGQESEEKNRLRDFKNYQVNAKLVRKASSPLVMHCLPAKRGLEITDEVLESKNSIVFEQAENRLHVQKALLCLLLGGIKKL
ncbi:MAG: ornithine carbamoyltransferase [Euryarchaeota archaeon]|nr:ornithine carbamoyltransferase [Euryarchaeota archaeon]